MIAEAGLTSAFLGSEDTLTKEKITSFFPAGHSYQGVVLLGEVAPAFVELLSKPPTRPSTGLRQAFTALFTSSSRTSSCAWVAWLTAMLADYRNVTRVLP